MNYPRYPKYKDTGIEWIGEIPEHWKVDRIKHTSYVKGRVGWKGLTSDEYLDDGYAYLVTGQDFSSKHIDWKSCYQIDKIRYDDDPYIQLKEGDLLLTKDGTIGKLAIVTNLTRPACLNSGIFLVRPVNSYFSDFLYWILSSQEFSSYYEFTSIGSTIQHLYQQTFENFSFSIPPISEQTKIIQYLEIRISEIDLLMKKQQKMMEILKEKRQTIITHAVTKGLDPDVPMKDSGIEWIGSINSKWPIAKIIYFSKLKTGGTPDKRVLEYWEDGKINWMSSGEINKDLIYEVEGKITELGYKNSNATLLPINSVMIALNGQGKTKGMVGILKVESTCNQSLAAFNVNEKTLHYRYLYYFLKSKYKQMRGLVGDDLRDGLSLSVLRELRIPVPSLQEQFAISNYLDNQINVIKNMISKQEKMIELLKEHRASLITHAVTGKIDVRGLVKEVNESARQTP